VKVEGEVIDTISSDLLLVRIAKGSPATLELTRVNTVCLPDRLQISVSARLGLLKTFGFEQRTLYSRCGCVPAAARAIDLAEDQASRSVGLNLLVKVTSP